MRTMLRVFSVVSLAPIGQSAQDCSPQQPEGHTAGLSFVQAKVRRAKVLMHSEQEKDDCGCFPGHTGWSSRAQRCSPSSWTSPEEAAACRRRSAEVDDCGCVPGRTGWSSRAQRCSHSSRTSPEEAAACKSDGRVDDCGCAPGRTGWSSRAQKCSSTSVTSPEEAATCRSRNVAPAPVPGPPAPGTDSGKLRLMSWNVYFGNGNFEAMAQMLQRYNVDIANLQETNNRLGAIARASGLVSANTWRQVHDWCGYNFHGSDWNHSWSKEVEVPGSRGVCGALMQRGNSKLCVWGLHPIQNRNNVRFSKESIRLAADEMKRCSSQFSAPSIFMGDFNTLDWRGALRQLEQSTGWSWSLAAKNHIDFIFIQTAPLSVGRVTHARVVGSGCVPGFPGNNKRTSSCGWSDHSPVYAEIQLR